ncbi:threonine/serine dehydratase [Virgibacillus sp. 179-BFC.A HS]|uniref:Threonine/serine dehydratase n=1 Tax=Tigheibacillus jepli TaxID=3035914 RepID=A0ABU5CFA1_9BACI|nr:threonine/serine dehydratase [Virgibacillus sp. 179-BFC.A HS]MDY0405000.1 threonine/serine dehydratase [Virgibacillus sp. 179-BFC.A HS]
MVTLKDILKAKENISDVVHQTPMLTSEQLDEKCGNKLFLKSEHLQKTGSFKIRGASNKVKQAVKDGATYITAASSGNHGQAVAYIANKLGIQATIVVPEDVIASKENAIAAYKSEIVYCGRTSAERLPKAKELAKKREGLFIPPYDDPLIIAGQGTVGLEIMEQVKDADFVLVPVGGGGLISGIATAVKEINPKVQVIGVEPELADDTYQSLKKGTITSIGPTTTIADGLRSSQPGDMTFPIMQKYVDDLVLVSEQEIKTALFFVMERMKQVIEPSGAVTVAAAMFNKLDVQNKRIVCVISGGNADLRKLQGLFLE